MTIGMDKRKKKRGGKNSTRRWKIIKTHLLAERSLK